MQIQQLIIKSNFKKFCIFKFQRFSRCGNCLWSILRHYLYFLHFYLYIWLQINFGNCSTMRMWYDIRFAKFSCNSLFSNNFLDLFWYCIKISLIKRISSFDIFIQRMMAHFKISLTFQQIISAFQAIDQPWATSTLSKQVNQSILSRIWTGLKNASDIQCSDL